MDSPLKMLQVPELPGTESPEVCAKAHGSGKPPQSSASPSAAPSADSPQACEAIYSVAVRSLCEFAARQGDLDLRFTPSPSAQQGREGHLLVAQRRGESYESEIRLSGRYQHLAVSGRADGYDPRHNELEEIKTYRGRLEAMPDNHRQLHWAQARVYAWLLCESRGLATITVSLVYFDVASQSETRLSERRSADELRHFFEALCQRFMAWAAREAAHRSRRDDWLRDLPFPLAGFRTGQRELAAASWRACSNGSMLRVQAPTGIGKTLGTLYPALRAMATRPLDRIFCLSARSTGRQLTLEAVGQIRAARADRAPMPLRVIEMVARDKSCEHPDKACHGESCPLARGFYDRLASAREQAAACDVLDRQTLRRIALDHRICPYYLGAEMLRWADVAIGDYNYWFDRHAVLYALTVELGWRVSVLIDEAHHLVGRARGMYSARAGLGDLLELREQVPSLLRARVDELINQWDLLAQTHQLTGDEPVRWQCLDELPQDWMRALQRLVSAIGEYLIEHASEPPSALLGWYLDSLSFATLAESLGDHSLCELSLDDRQAPASTLALTPQDQAQLVLRNIVPAPFLKNRFAAADSVLMFSATLNPPEYDRDLLGLSADTPTLDIGSPFRPEQLRVSVLPISTRFEERSRTLDRLVNAMAARFRDRPGNYLGFLSSFDYLDAVMARLRERHPDLPLWTQTRQMDEGARAAFLARFEPGGRGIGLAVLGGVFSEGIDLPGTRLIGAFIATMGMPQVDPVNEALSQRMETLFARGFDYTYVVPGIQKIVQAAGRVIRTPEDTGTVLLMDERYRWERYRRLLPASWGL